MPQANQKANLSILFDAVKQGEGPILLAVHNYPDPDSLASALGLQVMLDFWGIESHIADGSGIGRAENKAMAGILKIETTTFNQLDLQYYRGAILADTQPDVGNNELPPNVPLIGVFDHHPFVEENSQHVPCVDVRPEIGATSTIIYEYLVSAGIEIDSRLATALYLGIKTDTESLERHASEFDIAAYTGLLPLVDLPSVRKITRPPLSEDYFLMLKNAIENGMRYDEAVISYLGRVNQPDYLSIVAELLLQAKGAAYALAIGRKDGRVYLSLRVEPSRKNAGNLIKQAVGLRGSGGGHALAAGGVIHPPKGKVEKTIQISSRRFLQALDLDHQVTRSLCPSPSNEKE